MSRLLVADEAPGPADAAPDARAATVDERPARPGWRRWPAALDLLSVAVVFAGVVLFVPTVFSAPTISASDSGVFYSVFHQLSQGRRLYAEVFDHKDPLFYAGHTVAYAVFGLVGPMLWETILSLGLVAAMVLLAGRLGVPTYARLPVAAVFALLYYLPSIYVPIHTYHQGVALAVASLWLAAGGRSVLAGVVLGLAALSKLPLAALLPAAMALAALSNGASPPKRSPLSRFRGRGGQWAGAIRRGLLVFGGAVASAAVVLGVLFLRGELAGFGDAMLENLAYPALNPPGVSSFKTGATLWDKSTVLFTTPLTVTYLALLAFAAGVLAIRGAWDGRLCWPTLQRWMDPEGRAAALALAAGLGALVMVQTASWWSHHFQIAALAFAVALVPPLLLAARLARPQALAATLLLFLGVGWMLSAPSLAGKLAVQSPASRGPILCDIVMRSGRRIPSYSECDVMTDAWPEGTRFATIQQNNPGSLAAWTPPGMHLECRVFYQFPWLRPDLLDEFADCLESGNVDVVFRGPLSYDVPRLQRRIDRDLRRDFELVRRYGEIEVWQRR